MVNSDMHIEFKTVLDFLGDILDKIMIVSGFFLLILAVAFFSRAFQWFSSASILFGVFLIVIGAILHFEPLSLKLKIPSIEGLGTILICIAAEIMAAAVVVFLFAVPGQAIVLPTSFRRGPVEKVIVIMLTRPNAWLSPILAGISIGLLAFGVFLKFIRDLL